MAVRAHAQQRQLVTRNVLFVISEGIARRILPGTQVATFGEGCLALRCEGSELTATVELERHDVEPETPDLPWRVATQGWWQLTSGHLGVNELEGLLEWFPELGLNEGVWSARVSTCGGGEAADLEEQLLETESEEWPDGPERFLVQLWPHE